jgi:hypothetical protein
VPAIFHAAKMSIGAAAAKTILGNGISRIRLQWPKRTRCAATCLVAGLRRPTGARTAASLASSA